MTNRPANPARVVPPTLEAEVVIEDERWRAHPESETAILSAVQALSATAPELVPATAALTIVLSDDARVAAMNGRFRQSPAPTNVLSFPAGPDATEPGAPTYLGDIILARETIEREAANLAISVVHHVQHLALHGVLHLIDYDHLTDADAAVMEALETRVLATLGIANPYLLPAGITQE